MTVEIGNFERTQWVATYCSSGGVIYTPLGPDSQPIWGQSTFLPPTGDVDIKYPEGYDQWIERKNNGAFTASYSLAV